MRNYTPSERMLNLLYDSPNGLTEMQLFKLSGLNTRKFKECGNNLVDNGAVVGRDGVYRLNIQTRREIYCRDRCLPQSEAREPSIAA